DQSASIGNNRSLDVTGNEDNTIGGNRTVKVTGTQTYTILSEKEEQPLFLQEMILRMLIPVI
ncbi:hypothetical protein HYE60_01935, partial [Aggregatibacter actinomycetemcomitans]